MSKGKKTDNDRRLISVSISAEHLAWLEEAHWEARASRAAFASKLLAQAIDAAREDTKLP